MGRGKFFAFFNTEEQFQKFMLKYIQEHPEVLRAHNEEIRHVSRVFAFDLSTMALGRMGFREKRFEKYDEALTGVVNDYVKLWSDDLACDKDMEYSRASFERELKQYCGKRYVNEKERYA